MNENGWIEIEPTPYQRALTAAWPQRTEVRLLVIEPDAGITAHVYKTTEGLMWVSVFRVMGDRVHQAEVMVREIVGRRHLSRSGLFEADQPNTPYALRPCVELLDHPDVRRGAELLAWSAGQKRNVVYERDDVLAQARKADRARKRVKYRRPSTA